jgi:dTDP-4-dehydrorhamnose 3,5-epimerase-like enzyme
MTEQLPEGCRLFDLDVRGDARGSLVALESHRNVPFELRRAYYIFGTQSGVERGHHAHHDLRQIAIAVSGSCKMTLDDGAERRTVLLDRPDRALQIGTMIWREMSAFTPDCVLLVLADRHYDEGDYIRDYQQFLQLVRKGAQ